MSTNQTPQSPRVSMTEIDRLERAWGAAQPPRAAGGRRAIAGFRHQFEVALLESVRSWLAMPQKQRSDPAAFAETVADVAAIAADGLLVVTEAKRSLTHATVTAALAEFALIDEVATELEPSVAPVRYRVVGRHGDAARWQQWARTELAASPSTADLATRVSVAVEPDPRDETLALLANELGAPDPGATFDQAMVALFDGARNGDFRSAASSVWRTLVAASRADRAPGSAYLWTAADRFPAVCRAGDVLLGQQPLVHHLRDGFVHQRTAVSEQLTPDAVEWLDTSREMHSKLRVLWITGRLGSGKSIALLQLLAELHERSSAMIAYLGTTVGSLADVFDWVAPLAADSPVIVALDDPYPIDYRRDALPTWSDAIARLTASRQNGDGSSLPILIATGTDEQAFALEHDFVDDLVVERIRLPAEDGDSIAELADWYEQRTGRSVGPSAHDRPLVETVFEWTVGMRLREYALRYARRLLDVDASGSVLGAVQDVLAVNRLGAPYPWSAFGRRLDAAQHDSLRRVLAEVGLPGEGASPSSGVWISRGSLAAEIFDAWCPRDNPAQRDQRLYGGASAVLRLEPRPDVRAALVRALARTARTVTADGEAEPTVIERLYDVAVEVGGGHVPQEQLLGWLALARRGARLVEPDVVEDALTQFASQNLGRADFGPTVRAMLRASAQVTETTRSDLETMVISLLDEHPRWSEWPTVAIAAARALRSPALPAMIRKWAAERRLKSTGWALLEASRVYAGDADLVAAVNRVATDREHPGWAMAWGAAWAEGPDDQLAARAVIWLTSDTGANDSGSFGRVWTAVWGERDNLGPEVAPELMDCAMRFLPERFGHPGWSRVWSALWDTTQERDRLRALGLDWIPVFVGSRTADFAHVWRRLWDDRDALTDMQRAMLERNGLDWLGSSTDAAMSWGAVFVRLMDRLDDRELDWLGERWLLSSVPEHHSWGRVWRATWSRASAARRPALEARARDWLAVAPDDHLARSHVVKDLKRDRAVRAMTEEWLDRADERETSWAWTWLALADASGAEQRERAMRFLTNAAPHPAWNRVWVAVWDAAPDRELVPLAVAWLSGRPFDDIGRPYVARALVRADALAEAAHKQPWFDEFETELFAWLDAIGTWGAGGDFVWCDVFDMHPEHRRRLAGSGLRWLAETDATAAGWTRVWARLHDVAPGDEKLYGILSSALGPETRLSSQDAFRIVRSLFPGSARLSPRRQSVTVPAEGAPHASILRSILADDTAGMSSDTRRRVAVVLGPEGLGASAAHDRPLTDVMLSWLVESSSRSEVLSLEDELHRWLDAHPTHTELRTAVLRAKVASARDREELVALLDECGRWLAVNPTAAPVRVAYLHLIAEHGGHVALDAALSEGLARLEGDDARLSSTVLALSGRHGSVQIVKDALTWVVGYLEERAPNRSDEIIVGCIPKLYRRFSSPFAPADEQLRNRAEHIFSDWKQTFPHANVGQLVTSVDGAGAARRLRRRRTRRQPRRPPRV